MALKKYMAIRRSLVKVGMSLSQEKKALVAEALVKEGLELLREKINKLADAIEEEKNRKYPNNDYISRCQAKIVEIQGILDRAYATRQEFADRVREKRAAIQRSNDANQR